MQNECRLTNCRIITTDGVSVLCGQSVDKHQRIPQGAFIITSPIVATDSSRQTVFTTKNKVGFKILNYLPNKEALPDMINESHIVAKMLPAILSKSKAQKISFTQNHLDTLKEYVRNQLGEIQSEVKIENWKKIYATKEDFFIVGQIYGHANVKDGTYTVTPKIVETQNVGDYIIWQKTESVYYNLGKESHVHEPLPPGLEYRVQSRIFEIQKEKSIPIDVNAIVKMVDKYFDRPKETVFDAKFISGFLKAIERDDLISIKSLVGNKNVPNSILKHGFMKSAENGNLRLMDYFLERGAKLDDEYLNFAKHLAERKNQPGVIQKIVEMMHEYTDVVEDTVSDAVKKPRLTHQHAL